MKKINQLLREWPRGAVLTIRYLKTKQITAHHLKQYRKSGWIENVGRGAYRLKGDIIDWQGIVYGLQQEKNVHVGGKTALQLKGFTHFIPSKLETIFLYSDTVKTLPPWVNEIEWGGSFVFTYLRLFNQQFEDSFSWYRHNEFSIKISAPERAILEMLYHVPQKQSFDEAMKIMESLSTLRPQVIQKLLESCNSIKVKRLFLYMAEIQQHFWLTHLDISHINLGRGKRQIIRDGKLDKKYLITVPGD